MTQYNLFEYQETIRLLINKLLELLKVDDPDRIANVLVVLRNYWEKQQLGDKFPEFLKVCDDISEMNL